MANAPTFGIDLGTTCSAIALVRDGRPQILEIDGDPLVPSVVSFPASGEPLVGKPALHRLVLDPERTIRSAKRHMGSDRTWIIGERKITAPEVGALVLERLRRGAEEAIGVRPERVVITVPAWFTHGQRADTHRAAEIAGLEVARLINEPTAAALAHAHRNDVRRRALVYDLGGGTFDASLIDQDGTVVEVRASHGDTHLGGDDLDEALTLVVLERLRRDDTELFSAIQRSLPARMRILLAVQDAKHELSSTLTAKVRVPFLLDLGGHARHLECELERATLEQEVLPLLERTLACIGQVLSDAHVAAGDLDELLLVGGSTRIPLVWSMLRDHLGLEGNAAVPPDRAVALGAAIQAAIVDGSRVDGILVDVAPFSLSVAAITEPPGSADTHMMCRVVTPRNAPLPSRHTELFHTATPMQESVKIPVMQGSDCNPLRNTTLGEIVMSGLPPAPDEQGRRPISVEFRHDLDGMVTIRVTDELSGRSVDGRVAAGGTEIAELREKLVLEMREHDFVPGDGSDPDPFLEREASSSRDEAMPALAVTSASVSGDLDEARRAFDAILAAGSRLASEHAEHALELRRIAEAGREALQKGDDALALEHYDELSDQMFELGVWL